MEEERIGAAAGPETEMETREREREGEYYEDLMAVMAERLDAEEFMQELRAGFRVLAEEGRGVITAESLRRRAWEVLGLEAMTAEEAEAMVREGDLDGDGALGEAEFCVLMVRLSPAIMADAHDCLAKAVADAAAAENM